MREREFEVLGHELLDVRAADVVGLLHLDDLEDLQSVRVSSVAPTICCEWLLT